MVQKYVTMRVPADLYARIREIADASDRTLIWVLRQFVEKGSDYTSWEECGAVMEAEQEAKQKFRADLPAVREPIRPVPVAPEARRLVIENVPRHLLSSPVTRKGLDEQVEQMLANECDPRGIVLSLQEWVNRPDAYPGHLPHIYTELLKQRTARPKSKVDDNVQGWLDLGRQMKAQREMREQS